LPTTIAIMQPYFVPYAGYLRLLAASDLFVIYDCVQFPRRGWVHRNQLPDAHGRAAWLTLPLAKAPQEVLIRDLAFPDAAEATLAERLRAFPLPTERSDAFAALMESLSVIDQAPVDYLATTLERTAQALRLPWRVLRSSSLAIPAELRGQERILEIARRLGAKRYVNAPGGLALYDRKAFDAAGIELRFLTAYAGSNWSVLWRLASEDAAALSDDIHATAKLAA
jgi:WbqC-like protein family